MEIKQNKFAFFANFAETIRTLPPDKQALAYKALCEYGIYGVLPDDTSLKIMCLMAQASVFKEDGRKNNGGNHNPTGKNQHTELVNSGQSWSKLVKVGQFLSKQETETEIEDKEETKPKNKTSSLLQIDFNHRESFMRADPKSLVDALKRDIVPNLGAYLYTGKEPTDEQLNNYVQIRASTGWEKKGGTPIRSIGSDLANWLKNDKVESKDENKMSDKPMTYEEMIAQAKE